MTHDDIYEELPKEVCTTILEALGINVEDFMYNLSNDNPYEIMIFARIYDLYDKTRKL